MKGTTTINRVLGTLKRKSIPASSFHNIDPNDDSPEAIAIRNIVLFCESGRPGEQNETDEGVSYLPIVVDVCESSPSAAKEAAHLLRKLLSKEYYNQPYVQYNCIVLIRILAENPGATFTRNFDSRFVQTIRDLLRVGQDSNVRTLLVETLNKFLRDKAYYEGLGSLTEMWRKEQERMRTDLTDSFQITRMPINNMPSQDSFPQAQSTLQLPSSRELSMRIEEANTSAKLLTEVIQSTPNSEINKNELVQELANRCQNASISIKMYISAKNPAPDNDLMETLIETNDKINKAISKHQRAILQARRNKMARSTPETHSSNTSLSRSSSKGGNSRTTSGESVSRSSSERKSNSIAAKSENPFSGSKSDLPKETSSHSGSDSRYMMHAGGSNSATLNQKKQDSVPKTPIYRY